MQIFNSCTPSEMSAKDFIACFADIYEHSPWVAKDAYARGISREHNQITELHRLMAEVLDKAARPAKLALINAHPDLAGRAAIAGELTNASTTEQAGAGISHCSAEQFAQFSTLNQRYKDKFAFPFIMAVKGSDRFKIIAAFERRIHNDAETEFSQALQEINKIALFRLQDL
ncbi:MAG: 2-oxo-4-hydroxy-4-carboxy-5-ureidoimidazoline decarboxylase [Oceanospirillaceae bacterium]|nr:2-oxo-4-hydroxy-4-carboxy-5-ureidoimidazoline decarboxylase [Oceanospirillaceae bacterium]